MRSHTKHLVTTGLLWAVLTVVGELAVRTIQFNPTGYAREAQVVDGAFRLLVVLGLPVFTFVVAVLAYSVWRFRSRDATEDGPPIHGSKRVTATWLVVSSALSVYVIINPGLVGLAELWGHNDADLVVKVQAQRWSWLITYPEQEVVSSRLVLPVDKRVRFEVTSVDVVHSFWVPAFRTKIDAVPGLATTVYATPNRLGTFEQDSTLRVQCAEACGLAHDVMTSPVAVVEQEEFEAWLDEQKTRR